MPLDIQSIRTGLKVTTAPTGDSHFGKKARQQEEIP